ncbi:hypothetical protein A3I95_00180 [Candidatus Nomurabacteria bacterium RIFCSPLOWO2_02_FULL_44_12]|uniref:Cohesin domain-containing protein n=1 Tax=Candidatus Nomurabacteria bacterium RIFCSPLOWO2_12_FULL_44_11 TaxID=1801796 RepID=A0A1F6Y4C5_9BACT|nr:MAG: hypothetical protein A3E95_02320 [Candidatus Nomurabacteria bacterium RIFCSPHIGHO2_12_FULL_44_22b]OGJ01233.1 MAG: hypothetical protein A3G53_03760 [Candidatus Nomurabacteria bacterium RIFCSPLOWO2_12_FULL_44_11]OGJ08091.1 MAG: hypothetical protein A3I95_00180 [Candidatus Nomurabacteria bacterium RIFCSPLOWO2_02_FULL_44_12]
MEQIHNKLMESSKGYASWHEHPHHKKVHWGVIILILAIFVLIFFKGVANWRNAVTNLVVIEIAPPSAILTLDPKEKAVGVGDSFTVDVILDTDGKQVDGVDLYSLHYDPTILNVVDGVSAKPGIQVIPGTIMDFNAVNSVDQATGTIKFSQAATGGTSFSGKGVLASIHFKAVGKGSTYLKFDFSFGSTKDTNVAHAGKDQLARVVDALYTVK